MRHKPTLILPGKQSGSALVISMIILIIVMLMGVMAMTTSDTQFKMSGNLQFQNVAMNNAETAISNAEQWLSQSTNFNSSGFATYNSATPNLYPIVSAIDPLTMSWDDTNSIQITDPITNLQNPDQRYFIQAVSANNVMAGSSVGGGGNQSTACDKVNTYLIVARGASVRGSIKFVQTYYSVLINNGDPSQGC